MKRTLGIEVAKKWVVDVDISFVSFALAHSLSHRSGTRLDVAFQRCLHTDTFLFGLSLHLLWHNSCIHECTEPCACLPNRRSRTRGERPSGTGAAYGSQVTKAVEVRDVNSRGKRRQVEGHGPTRNHIKRHKKETGKMSNGESQKLRANHMDDMTVFRTQAKVVPSTDNGRNYPKTPTLQWYCNWVFTFFTYQPQVPEGIMDIYPYV